MDLDTILTVSADVPGNLLQIAFIGHVRAVELKEGTRKLEIQLATLRPGFYLLTDLTKLESMELACAPIIEKFMDLCSAREIDTVVRIIPDRKKDIGFNIMSLFHYGRKVHIVTCETPAEAQRALQRKT
jgi:hypothetical protein